MPVRSRPPVTPGLSRRGVLTAAGAGIGVVVVTIGRPDADPTGTARAAGGPPGRSRGPQGVPVNRTAAEAKGRRGARPRRTGRWRLTGRRPYALSLAELETLTAYEARLPDHGCVEGWSVNAQWRGLRVCSSLVERAGGDGRVRGSASSARVETEPATTARRCSGRSSPAAAAGHPSERRAAQPRPRLSAAADRPEPARRAQHQVAQPDRGAVMRPLADHPGDGRDRRCGLFGVGRAAHPDPAGPVLVGLGVWLIARRWSSTTASCRP